jgi:hypothetical protein
VRHNFAPISVFVCLFPTQIYLFGDRLTLVLRCSRCSAYHASVQCSFRAAQSAIPDYRNIAVDIACFQYYCEYYLARMGNSETKLQRTASNSNFLMAPVTSIESLLGRGIDLMFAEACMQGWRSHMEDAHTMNVEVPGMPQHGIFAIFDGHAGRLAAHHSARTLVHSIVEEVNINQSLAEIREGLRRAFIKHDNILFNTPEIIRDHSGTTCTLVFATPTHYIFTNLGDSRAVLARGTKVVFATKDHKPSNPVERNRIKAAGGFVLNDRVDGGLAVSRAFGDFDYKVSSMEFEALRCVFF